MRLMKCGTAAAFVSLILIGTDKAQQPCNCAGAGVYPSGPVYPTTMASEPIVSQAVVSQPVVTEFVASAPILGGIIQDQPVATGEVFTPAPIPTVAPVVTSLPAVQQVLPYSYWVLAPNPSRVYVEYGEIDQFRYQGRAYGNPSDRWSWYYLGGGDSRYLAKYYYPILQ
jgi:hypothetical protein